MATKPKQRGVSAKVIQLIMALSERLDRYTAQLAHIDGKTNDIYRGTQISLGKLEDVIDERFEDVQKVVGDQQNRFIEVDQDIQGYAKQVAEINAQVSRLSTLDAQREVLNRQAHDDFLNRFDAVVVGLQRINERLSATESKVKSASEQLTSLASVMANIVNRVDTMANYPEIGPGFANYVNEEFDRIRDAFDRVREELDAPLALTVSVKREKRNDPERMEPGGSRPEMTKPTAPTAQECKVSPAHPFDADPGRAVPVATETTRLFDRDLIRIAQTVATGFFKVAEEQKVKE